MIRKVKEFCTPTHIIMFFISLLMFAIMLNYAGMKGFWFDEIGSLFWVSAPFMDMARATMSMREPVSFPFYALGHLWYALFPFGEKYLLLMTEIPIAAAVFVTGLAAEKIMPLNKLRIAENNVNAKQTQTECILSSINLYAVLVSLFGAASALYIF